MRRARNFLFVRYTLPFVLLVALGAVVKAQMGPLALLPPNQATHTVQNSGNWSDPNTWGGSVPNNLAKVFIPAGMTVTVDGEIATRLKIIRIQGKMQFSTTTNTGLNVETIVQDTTGELEIGTSNNPIPAGVTCKITIIDEGDLVFSTSQFEKGLTLMGKTVAYGAQKTSWSRLTSNPSAGASTLNLQTAPTGWEVGDRIVITGTDPVDATSDEVATVQSINGSTVTLAQPLTKSHTTPANDLFVHVANLNRNIVIESESPTSNNGLDRGHIMFMATLDVDFNNVRVSKMGRSRKDIPIDDWSINENDEFVDGARTNIRGRYSIHFHRGGVNMNLSPAYVRGCVVEDDPGWAYANHSAFVHFENNVSYNVIGGAFQTEAGDELGSFTNNIAVRTVNSAYPLRQPAPFNAPDTREGSQDFAFQGDGFWVHGGGVSLTGNVASGCSGHAYIYWPEGLIEPIGPNPEAFRKTFLPTNIGLPNSVNVIPDENVLAIGWVKIAGFQNNEGYSATIGLATFYLHTTFFADKSDYDPAYIDSLHSSFNDLTCWNIDRFGVQLNFTERVTFKNMRLVNNDVDTSSIGFWGSQYRTREKVIIDNPTIQGYGTGLEIPTQGKVTVNCGTLQNRINMLIPNAKLHTRDLRIDGVTTSVDPAFSNPIDILMQASLTPPEDKSPLHFLLPDKIILNYGPYSNQRLSFDQQAASFVPLPSDTDPYTFFNGERYIRAEFAGKSNQQLQNDYSMSFGGSILPSNAVSASGIVGGKIYPWQNETLNVPVCLDVAREDRTDDINNCWAAASNKVAGPLPAYTHPTGGCVATSSVEALEPENSLVVYPNPTSGVFTIATSPSRYRVDVLNTGGSLVQSFSGSGDQLKGDLSHLPAGMYFVRVLDLGNGQADLKKLVKTN